MKSIKIKLLEEKLLRINENENILYFIYIKFL